LSEINPKLEPPVRVSDGEIQILWSLDLGQIQKDAASTLGAGTGFWNALLLCLGNSTGFTSL